MTLQCSQSGARVLQPGSKTNMKEESSVKQIYAPVERVYSTLSNLENLRPLLERAQNDESLRDKLDQMGQGASLDGLKDVVLTNDSISVPAPMFGTISMNVVDREENKCIKFQTDKSPIEAKMWIQVLPVTAETSKMRLTVDANIPFMLKAMVGSKLKEGLEKVADALAMIQY